MLLSKKAGPSGNLDDDDDDDDNDLLIRPGWTGQV